MSTPFKALLVEGTSGVGKSTLIDALIRRHVSTAKPRKIRSLIHLAQSHTYGPLAVLEDKTLTVHENARHLDGIVKYLEWLHASVQEHDKPWCFVVIDTLHITQCVRPGVVGWADVASFDQRLAALGCKLLCLEVTPTAIWERGIKPRMNEQFILVYAKKFGSTHQEIHSYFVQEQETLKELFDQSSMCKVRMVNEGRDETTTDAAYSFWCAD
jgi:Cdc6-like AAA superfamily ATPase